MKTARAKLFPNGGSQAVRLPKDFRFSDEETEVLVRRDGRRVILEPVDEWPLSFTSALGSWDEDLERPEQTPIGELGDRLG